MDKRLLRQAINALQGDLEAEALCAPFSKLIERVDTRLATLAQEQQRLTLLQAASRQLVSSPSLDQFVDQHRAVLQSYLEALVDGDDATLPDEFFATTLYPEDAEASVDSDAGDPGDDALYVEPPSAGSGDELRESIESDPELLEAFSLETNEHLENIEGLILEAEAEASAEVIDALFRAFHSIKGNSSFFGFLGIQHLAHEMETILDQVRTGELEFSKALQDLVLRVQSTLLAMTAEAFAELRDVQAPEAVLTALADFLGAPAATSPEAGIEAQDDSVNEAANVEVFDAAEIERTPETAVSVQAAERAAASSSAGAKGTKAASNEVVRVDAARLDFLVDLIGELVINYSIVSDGLDGLKGTSNRLQQGAKQLNAIIRDLQSLSTALRMVPIRPIFQRMKRLVRDVSAQTGKAVAFEVLGEETQVDKSLVDEVGDPLVHLIRNAIDHGIETEAERRRDHKSPEGQLRLSAEQRGSWIIVELQDDGKGLDTQRIRTKAIERGLMAEDAVLPDERIHEMIMHPGFSTAQQVSDVSGRGVGMDVVKRSVEALKGSLDIRSIEGRGTTFTLRFPLTLAIIDGVVAKLADEQYIVPASAIVQTVPNAGHAMTTIAGDEEVVVYRNEAIPLVLLSDLYDVPGAKRPDSESLLMVIDCDNKRFALMVDELLGKQHVVIKSLDALLKDTQGIAGSAIMPDGTVGLIVDVDAIAKSLQGRIDAMVAA